MPIRRATSRPLPERLNARNSALWCEFDVGALRVRAYLVDRRSRLLSDMVHEGKQGGWDPDSATILVGWDLADDVADGALFHELTHAIIFAYGIKLHPDHELDDDEEEVIVNALSANVFDTLRRNDLFFVPARPELPRGARR